MKTVAICNVGERDVRYNASGRFLAFDRIEGRELARLLNCEEGTRYIAERILELLSKNAHNTLPRLRFPIIKPFLDHVLEKGHIDLLLLVVTDQQKAEERFRSRDTINSGYILEKLVEREFGMDMVGEILLLPVIEAPHRIEEAYEFFSESLPRHVPPEEDPQVHVLAAGGVPALNYALAWKALSLYGKGCHVYQVEEPPKGDLLGGRVGGNVQPAEMLRFHRDMVVRTAMDLVKHYDYTGALAMLEDAFEKIPSVVQSLIRCAAFRMDLNFVAAVNELKQPMSQYPLLESWYQRLRNPTRLDYLVEMFWMASIRCEQKAYSDMLWRVAAFYENALRLIAEKTIGISEDDLKAGEISVKKLKGTNPDFQKFLEQSEQVSPKKGVWKVNVPFLMEACRYGCKGGQTDWEEIYDNVTLLTGLWGLRNEVMHNLKGASRKMLLKHFKIPPNIREEFISEETHDKLSLLIHLMQKIISQIGKLMGAGKEILCQNPYQQINDYISEQLRKEMMA